MAGEVLIDNKKTADKGAIDSFTSLLFSHSEYIEVECTYPGGSI